MNGQKQIFTLFVIMVFICMLSFVKYVRKRDKELKLQRENKTKIELEQSILEALNKQIEEEEKHQRWLDMMKEYNDVCYMIHALIIRPEKEILPDESDKYTGTMEEVSTEFPASSTTEMPIHSKKDEKSDTKTKSNSVSESIIYLFLLVLIYSLIKAASDISQHFSKKKQEEEERADRRRSLQEYATVKNETKNQKAPFLRRSTVLGMDTRTKPFNKLLEERRLSRIIAEEIHSGLITEPATPAKISDGIATKPPPLIRRCSVPAFLLQNMGQQNKLRRPSIDSFSEDDSSPDVKRRVRMIHRH